MLFNYRVLPVFLITTCLVLAANCWAKAEKGTTKTAKLDSSTLAVINGKSITVENFKAEMARRQGVFSTEKKEELLDNIVRSELLFAAAKNAGYEKDPEVIAAVKEAMVSKYLRTNLDPKLGQLVASEEEAMTYYLSHQAEFGTPAMIHPALIHITVSPKTTTEKRAELLKRAETARTEALALEAGVPGFGGVAVRYSEDQGSRYRGGDVDWLAMGDGEGSWDKKVMDAMAALDEPGEISPIIDAADGYYLVKLIEAKAAEVKPFAEVKDGLLYLVVQEKKQKLETELIEQLKRKIPVTVHRELLQSITITDERKSAGPPALPTR